MQAWLASSLRRFYPSSPAESGPIVALEAARGERVSFQAVFRTEARETCVEARVEAVDGVSAQVRRVGYVPVPHLSTQTPLTDLDGVAHLPGLAPDPLLPETTVYAGPFETNAFWVTLHVAADLAPGVYPVAVTLSGEGGEPATLSATVVVGDASLPRRDFPVTNWLYADALCDCYHVELVDEAFWRILGPYVDDLVGHGQDTLYVPVFTPPLDGVKRPTQLLGVARSGDGYALDWSLVRRWVATARARGVANFEWVHLFTQWGARNALRIYEGHGEGERLLWPPETEATSDTYRAFLGQYLGELQRFLQAEGLLERSFFHLSDEPHGEADLATYRAARTMLRDLAPWLRVMDALTEIEFAREGVIDTPVPLITTAPDFVREGIPAWAYFCTQPRGRYLNRLLDTPLVKIRMTGWLLYRLRARGFLHWGYNYWYRRQSRELINPYAVTDAHAWPSWPPGDPFQVYPGAAGPVDSLRWEVFAESLQDYALLQAAGISPDDALLGDIESYAEFPRDPAWIAARRSTLLRVGSGRSAQ
ncbi:MAG: DUF4091 domain-containing protein [Anaerolineae bacterium]